MRILVIDKFMQPRDPAQTDMYSAIASQHYVTFSSKPMEDVMVDNYDLLYLGIYHQAMKIDLCQLLHYNKKPIIIDQADNEEWISRNKIRMHKNIKYVLSRYLPNEALENYCREHGLPLALLPWYVNPDRFYPAEKRAYDVSFVCSMYGRRNEIAEMVKVYGTFDWKSVMVGEFYGDDYAEILSKSYVSIMECGRKCLTQKYIEASLCDCVLVGDKPLYPANELVVYDHIPDNYTNMQGNRGYILKTFANKKVFMDNFNELLK